MSVSPSTMRRLDVAGFEAIVKSLDSSRKRQQAVLADTELKLKAAQDALAEAREQAAQRDLVAQSGRK